MATIKDIAAKLNISPGTVSKGLNGAKDISETLRQQILDTAVEMGYTKRGIEKTKNRKLCVFVENMDFYMEDDFGYDIILGFKQAAYKEKWGVEVVPVSHLFQERRPYSAFMVSQGYSGALILGFAYDDPWMSELQDTKIPTVLFDHYLAGNPMVGFVGTDSDEGMDLAIRHLQAMGHEKIAFVDGDATSMISEFRMQAYKKSMKANGLPLLPELSANAYYGSDVNPELVLNMVKAGATAICCGSDMIAYSVIHALSKAGIRVPEDISIIGYDDLPTSASFDPPLTTVLQDRIMIGKSGYYILYALVQGVSLSRNLLRPALVKRRSTGRLKEA